MPLSALGKNKPAALKKGETSEPQWFPPMVSPPTKGTAPPDAVAHLKEQVTQVEVRTDRLQEQVTQLQRRVGVVPPPIPHEKPLSEPLDLSLTALVTAALALVASIFSLVVAFRRRRPRQEFAPGQRDIPPSAVTQDVVARLTEQVEQLQRQAEQTMRLVHLRSETARSMAAPVVLAPVPLPAARPAESFEADHRLLGALLASLKDGNLAPSAVDYVEAFLSDVAGRLAPDGDSDLLARLKKLNFAFSHSPHAVLRGQNFLSITQARAQPGSSDSYRVRLLHEAFDLFQKDLAGGMARSGEG